MRGEELEALRVALAQTPERGARVEAASLQSRLIALADSLPVLVSFIDRDERYQYVNAAYERWFGVPKEEVVGRAVRELLGEGGYSTVQPHLRQALAGKAARFRWRFDYPSNSRDVDVLCQPIIGANGAVEGAAVLVQDVTTEARIAELERLRRDAERQVTRRLESLLTVTCKLAGASSADEIARVLVDEGVAALEATMSGMWLVSPTGGELVLTRERGLRPQHVEVLRRLPVANAGVLTECVETARPVWIESRAEYAARYPDVEAAFRPDPAPPLAFAMLPLLIEGKVAGCIQFGFHDERRLTPDQRTYLEVLASHGAEALRRARLYAELRDVSETHQAMIQASPAAIVLLDSAGVVHAWNPAAERIFGWTAAETLGHPLLPVGHCREEFLANVGYVLAGNVIDGHATRRLRKNGEWFDVELYAAPASFSDGRTMCLSMIVDVSERKRVERGRQLVADASAILARTLDWKATLGEVVKLPLAEFADWCCLDLLSGGELERIAMSRADIAPGARMPRRIPHSGDYGGASLAIATRTPQLVRDVDDATLKRLARNDEHLRALRAFGMRSGLSVPLIAGDRLLGAFSFVSTSRNFDELDLAIASELASHTANAVEAARLFDEATAARRDAESANRAKDQFLAMLGHELRNPLAPMTTALELMRMRAPGVAERERSVIQRQVAHLSRLVDDLLDISRITRGKVELRYERTTVGAAVAKAIELTSPLLEQRRHYLTVDVPQDLAVRADPVRLSQIVANLVSNAAKYAGPGGRIDVRALRRGGDIVLTVRDDGIGIAPEMLGHIFETFVQAPQGAARKDGGLGLGLPIVRSLVELHGGKVTAQSDGLGKGCTMTVTLPADSTDLRAAQPAPAPRARRSASGRRILIVDDNEDAANVLSELLDSYGHEIRTAFDGPSALRIAEAFRPEIAVLDLGLPVMDGYELAERLRASARDGAVRLIAVTGYGQDGDRERTRAAGFEAHMAKPVSIDLLLELVDRAT